MAHHPLFTPIDYLSGIGTERANVLKSELGIFNYRDLLYHFPFRYVDRTQYFKINQLAINGSEVQIKGEITDLKEVKSGRKSRLVGQFSDETGTIELVWFRTTKWLKDKLQSLLHKDIIVYGKPTLFGKTINITHPELEEAEKQVPKGFFPVYSSTEKVQKKGINTRIWQQMQQNVWNEIQYQIKENLSQTILNQYKLIPRTQAFRAVHFPKSHTELTAARNRLKFEELFFLHLSIQSRKAHGKRKFKSYPFETVGEYFNTYYNQHLNFDLTNAQKKVIKEIRSDLGKESQMNRLLQGDVGSGKTVVALLSMLLAADNRFQSLLLAPTEVLAQQHYNSLANEVQKLGLNIGLLTGSTTTKERTILHEQLQNGEIHFLVGTHAIIEDKVKFKNLGLAIVDEQHKFGVAQRAKLWKKSDRPPHILVMTATPIPRTLSMTLYGDLDISVIDELPMGRKPIQTKHLTDKNRLGLFRFMKDQIKLGRQIYVVYPLIEESSTLDYKDLMDGYESITREFPLPDYAVSIVHGKMKPEAKAYEMEQFEKGKTQIMVATTVIEVGVNVPNASVMVIESAEKFGLSQLHQLRGRVGRGADQSYCFLMTKEKLNEKAYTRIKTLCETNDGFRIAEVDLELRGPGNVMGTQQSGLLDFKIVDLNQDKPIFMAAKHAVESLLDKDEKLENKENQPVQEFFAQYYKKQINWGIIS